MGYELRKVVLTATIADVSSAGQIFIAIPDEFGGEVVEIRTVLNGAIGTADVDLTPKIGGTAMTNGLITIATASSATGDTGISRPTSNNAVAPGDTIEIETDGESSNAVSVFITVVIRR